MVNSRALKLRDWALEQTGNHEHGENNIIYNDKFYGYHVEGSAYPWCAAFVQVGLDEIGHPCECRTAGCTTWMHWAQSTGRWHSGGYGIHIGDIVMFEFDGDSDDADHVGIVVDVQSSNVITVEGNYNDAVSIVVRRRSECLGFIRLWEDVEEVNEVTVPMLVNGSKGEPVKRMQSLLVYCGYGVGSCGIDGDFGEDTEAAVRKYQKRFGLEVDGIVGPETWGALLGLK